MTTISGLYETSSHELTLLESLDLVGRKSDLRQLLKWLKLSKSGQTKTVLITGDPGIGKSALMDAMIQVTRKCGYGRVLDLRRLKYESPEKLYLDIIDRFEHESEQILDHAYRAVAELTEELGIYWSMADFVEALTLVQLPFSTGESKSMPPQEQLNRKIRNDLSAFKKLVPGIQKTIDRIEFLMSDPWLQVAKAFKRGDATPVANALALSKLIQERRAAGLSLADEVSSLWEEGTSEEEQPEITTESSEAVPDKASVAEESATSPVAETQGSEVQGDEELEEPPQEPETEPSPRPSYQTRPASALQKPTFQEAFRRKKNNNDLVHHLFQLFQFVSMTVQCNDGVLLVAIDDWDDVMLLGETQREALKGFLSRLFEELAFRKSSQRIQGMLLCLCARNEGLSYSLGSALYNGCQHKLLLSGLDESARRAFFLEPFQAVNIELQTSVFQRISALTHGNPFWLIRLRQFILDWAQTNQVETIGESDFLDLGIYTLEDLLEYNFCRVKLSFLEEEDVFLRILGRFIHVVQQRAFCVPEIIEDIHTTLDVSQDLIFQALRGLFINGFVVEAPAEAKPLTAGDDPVYQFQSRLILDFLRRKTSVLQQDVSVEEKLVYLKKIIPLSLKAGELDRQKTLEILAMNEAFGNDDIPRFLEATFLEHVNSLDPKVRVAAINNLSTLPSEKTIQVLLSCLSDADPDVREHVARNLASLVDQSIRSRSHTYDDMIVEALTGRLHDESESVRVEMYGVLAQYQWNSGLIPLFVDGLSDGSEAVRLKALEALLQFEPKPAALKKHLLTALEDASTPVRKIACQALSHYLNADTLEALVKVLLQDPEAEVRAMAAQVMGPTESKRPLEALKKALHKDPDEDVRIAVARSLGKWNGWPVDPVERIFLDFIKQGQYESPTVLWMCVHSLSLMGETHLAMDALAQLREYATNEIVTVSIDIAARKVAERMNQVQNQLEVPRLNSTSTAEAELDPEIAPAHFGIIGEREPVGSAGPRPE